MTTLPRRAPAPPRPAALAAAALLAAACGNAAPPRPAAGAPAASGAPAPRAAALEQCGTNAHDRHAASGVACQACHPCGGKFEIAPFTYPGGTATEGGTVVVGTGGAPTTCTVACHYPKGAPSHPVTWTTPGPLDCTACHLLSRLPPQHPPLPGSAPTRADCEGCHDGARHTQGTVRLVGHPASWMAPADPGFHAHAANRGLGACQGCHRADLSGGVTGVSCGSCHDRALPPGVGSWRVNCVMCHGGGDNATGAPPRATWGQGTDPVRVGAHTTHVTAGALAPAFDCTACHEKPSDALTPDHVGGPTAGVAFGGLAVQGSTPSWDRATATCSNVYCHGATLPGGAQVTPRWAPGGGETACEACHGVPPPAPHPIVVGGLPACNVCHGKTVDAGGAVIPPAAGGLHLNGTVEAAGHEASWTDPSSPDFHAFSANRGLASCQACHGADLEGGTARTACGQCHDRNLPAGVASWKVNCVGCHGGVGNATGAPPRPTWGNDGDPLRVGAHAVHVAGTRVTLPLGCEACHVRPASALSPGHVDAATARVVFGGAATLGGANPSWSRASGSCAATYCHGNYAGTFAYTFAGEAKSVDYAGPAASPGWTGGPMGCTGCHGNPPSRYLAWHGLHANGTVANANDCQTCHPDATGTNGKGTSITNLALHMDGKVDVTPRWTSRCFRCH